MSIADFIRHATSMRLTFDEILFYIRATIDRYDIELDALPCSRRENQGLADAGQRLSGKFERTLRR